MKKVAEKNLKKNYHRCIAAPVKIGTQNGLRRSRCIAAPVKIGTQNGLNYVIYSHNNVGISVYSRTSKNGHPKDTVYSHNNVGTLVYSRTVNRLNVLRELSILSQTCGNKVYS